ncbi:unnamed protein product [Symbiodinium natans]|uniref:Uncharacterized protein n=1 Tax=Symbiodinium natans TaxID=878477 RepID=A0A812J606_9DINO|nr:unnamed protein product [Symbiodinium natans]
MRAARLLNLGEDAAFFPPWALGAGRTGKLASYASFLEAPPQRRRYTSFEDEPEHPTKATAKILGLNGKVINITRRLGETQLSDPASGSTEWEVNQQLCEKDECPESTALVTVKECVVVKNFKKGMRKALPKGHFWEDDKDCKYVQLPLAMVISEHGKCLSGAAGGNLTEKCNPMMVNCGHTTACNKCFILQRATENSVFTGWKLKTACGGLRPPKEMAKVMSELGLKVQKAKFLTMDADGSLKFTDEYNTEQDRQIWNLTPSNTSSKVDEVELHEKMYKKPFLLENVASKRFLLHERPPLTEDTARSDPLNTYMAQLPEKESMPEPFKNDTAEANTVTIIQKKQWRRGFWQGVEKAGSTYLQGEMMRADGKTVPTFNYLSAGPDKGYDFTRHLRAEDLSDDCHDRWTFVPKERGYELRTDCEHPEYLVAMKNGDGPVQFHKKPYPGPEGLWNVIFAKPPPPEPPLNQEKEAEEPQVVDMPADVPPEVEEMAKVDPEKEGNAMEMVKEGDQAKAIAQAEAANAQ